MTGGGPDTRALAARISGAWVQFARTGNPNHDGLPGWSAFDAVRRSTMTFSNTCEAKDDPDGEEIQAIKVSMSWT